MVPIKFVKSSTYNKYSWNGDGILNFHSRFLLIITYSSLIIIGVTTCLFNIVIFTLTEPLLTDNFILFSGIFLVLE